jgi:hypothetical protein
LPEDVSQHITLLAGGKISGDDCVVFTLIYDDSIVTVQTGKSIICGVDVF